MLAGGAVGASACAEFDLALVEVLFELVPRSDLLALHQLIAYIHHLLPDRGLLRRDQRGEDGAADRALLAHKAWWLPKWLDRVLSNVDVEGGRLHKELADRPEDPNQDRGLVNA